MCQMGDILQMHPEISLQKTHPNILKVTSYSSRSKLAASPPSKTWLLCRISILQLFGMRVFPPTEREPYAGATAPQKDSGFGEKKPA